jgi:hypothetical protein
MFNRMRVSITLALVLPFLGNTACCEEKDKISTDRPDFVDSTDVVGKGRFQVETSVAVERRNADGGNERTFTTPTLLRMGISDHVELRLSTDGRIVSRTEDNATGISDTRRGFGDSGIGLKWHVKDAKEGSPSIGVVTQLDVDSGSAEFRRSGVRPSVRVSAEWELPSDMSLGAMSGLAHDRNASGGRFASGILGLVLGKSWNDRVSTFVEIAMPQIAHAKDGGTASTFDIGAGYLLSKDWQVDIALFKGLNKYTPDTSWTIGLSGRF